MPDSLDQSRANAGSIIERTDFETWLSGSPQPFALARSFDPNAMRVVQSGKEKEDLLGRPITAFEPPLL